MPPSDTQPRRATFDWRRWGLVPIVTWLILLFGILYTPMPLYGGRLNSDSDNYMRADQVRDFLDGSHGWYDTVQRRLDPPGGADVYSRLVDLPLDGVALLAKPFVGSLESAILFAAFVVPFVLQLPLFFWLLGWAFRPLLGRPGWLLPALTVCYPGLIGEFMPGCIDHHSYQIMLVVLAIGAMLRFWLAADDTPHKSIRNSGLVLGMALAVSLAIGVEGLPWLGALLGMAGYALWCRPYLLRPAALAFAASAPLASALLLVAFRTPQQFMQPTLYVMSLVSIKVALAAAAVFALAAVAGPRIAGPLRRGLAFALIAAVVGAILLADTPGLLRGPWLGFDPWLVAFTSRRVNEMRRILEFPEIARLVEGLGIAALGGYWYGFITAPSHRKLLLLMFAILSATVGAMALFYAGRLDRFWFIFSLPGLFYALDFVRCMGRWLIARRPQVVVALSLLLAVAPPILIVWRHAHLAAESSGDPAVCSTCLAANYLNAAYPQPQRILAYDTVGPELVWRTPHIVFGGGVYNNAYGLYAARSFFITAEPRAAAKVLQDLQIDLVYVLSLPKAAASLANQTDEPYDLPLHADDPNGMMQRLRRGERFPWLAELNVPFNTRHDFSLYAVDHAALAKAAR